MNLSVNLQIRQSQSLVMTPQLLQSIRLLQFHHLELEAFLEREADANPLIEIDRSTEPQAEDALSVQDLSGSSPGEAEALAPLTGQRDDADVFADAAARIDGAEYGEDLAPSFGMLDHVSLSGPASDHAPEVASSTALSLRDHALREISDVFSDVSERRIAAELFSELTDAGYLAPGFDERTQSLDLCMDTAERLLSRLQDAAEPAGLFARDLAECLTLQLRRRNRFDPVMAVILSHLPLLARRDFAALARLCGETEGSVADILAEIRTLNPRPGADFAEAEASPIVPDVVASESRDGTGWRLELNPVAFPRVSVRTPEQLVRGSRTSSVDRAFLSSCQQSATWLQRSLEQRAHTILKVAAEILRRQDRFLTEGVSGLSPMTLMDVAQTVDLHESTVSRVTAGKYIATPRGTFEMKFFFTVAIASANGGEAHSAESVKLRIGRMIAGETAGSVLSDDDIAARLKADGVDLARRTVAKYREALGLPSSVQRRRELNAQRLAG